MEISILDIIEDTTVDGPGLRFSIYSAGCPNECPGCHNPESWNINNGRMMSTKEIFEQIKSNPFVNVTFSGGDPMYQAAPFAELARMIKENTDKDIWCYTGYTFENIINNPLQKTLLSYIDVLVDGPFVQSLKDEKLLFRGSRNQRLIDVKKSLKQGKVTEYETQTII